MLICISPLWPRLFHTKHFFYDTVYSLVLLIQQKFISCSLNYTTQVTTFRPILPHEVVPDTWAQRAFSFSSCSFQLAFIPPHWKEWPIHVPDLKDVYRFLSGSLWLLLTARETRRCNRAVCPRRGCGPDNSKLCHTTHIFSFFKILVTLLNIVIFLLKSCTRDKLL